jgi:two-component system, NarL family, sensor kinase
MQTEDTQLIIVILAGTAIFLILSSFITFFLFFYKQKQQANTKEKAALHAQHQQEILQTQIEIQNQTLQHVGQELHDNIGQLLSVVRFQLNVLETEPQPSHQQVRDINEVVGQAVGELRALSKSLDSSFVSDFGLVQSLSQELARIKQTGKCYTHLDTHGDVYRLPSQTEMVLFRIAQELINNTLKHAAASDLGVALHYEPARFGMLVQDNGRGFDYEQVAQQDLQKSGAGFRNIRRRSELIGGTCQIESTPERGTTVQIWLKMPFNDQKL